MSHTVITLGSVGYSNIIYYIILFIVIDINTHAVCVYIYGSLYYIMYVHYIFFNFRAKIVLK